MDSKLGGQVVDKQVVFICMCYTAKYSMIVGISGRTNCTDGSDSTWPESNVFRSLILQAFGSDPEPSGGVWAPE